MNTALRNSSWVLVLLSFLLHEVSAQQVQWEFTNGPWYARRVLDMDAGSVGSLTHTYAVNFLHSGGVVVKSTDGGKTWRQILEDWQPRSVATVANDANIVYVGSASGIRKSVDGGQTWAESVGNGSRQIVHPVSELFDAKFRRRSNMGFFTRNYSNL